MQDKNFIEMPERTKIIEFVSFCIEIYKNHYNLSGTEVMSLFERYGVLNFIEECYEALQTQGNLWLIAEFDEFINNRKQ